MLSFGKNTKIYVSNEMSGLSVLLFPFAVIFRIATGIRNHLYSVGHKKSFQFEVPVVNVGNLNIGGSGKTPTIEYLIRLLKKEYAIATLSRGYGRRTSGLRFATPNDNAATLGDEPYQFYRNFNTEVKVVVGEDRAFAIPNILHEYPSTSLILLDDAYQHRRVNPHLNILLTDFEKPFYKDFLLPMGRLREGRKGVKRADIIIVTKCTELIDKEVQNGMKKEIERYAGTKPVFFSFIRYGSPQPFQRTNVPITPHVVLLSGIAKPQPLEDFVSTNFVLVKHFRFKDHYLYTLKDIVQLRNFINNQAEKPSILTTEKDMVRLLDPKFSELLLDLNCFFLPIEMDFVENGVEFDRLVRYTIEKAAVKSNPEDE
ncbi:MAG: tetraacyldisaccharide 4'-kinase [Cyclobacteriaceae bacterium]|nr:tetraacyldisaccharide 4'-kinase [Cyclobacteriaceae bacterium]